MFIQTLGPLAIILSSLTLCFSSNEQNPLAREIDDRTLIVSILKQLPARAEIDEDQAANNNSIIQLLPDENWLRVCSYLPLRDHASFQLSCLKLSNIANDRDLWFSHYIDLPIHRLCTPINYSTITVNDLKNIIEQYYLLVKIFALDADGQYQQAQQLLQNRFPKLHFTETLQWIDDQTASHKSESFDNCHDIKTAYRRVELMLKKDYITEAEVNEAQTIIDQLLIQRYTPIIYDYFNKIRHQHNNYSYSGNEYKIVYLSNNWVPYMGTQMDIFKPKDIIQLYKIRLERLRHVQDFVEQLLNEGTIYTDAAMEFKFQGLYYGDFYYVKDKEKAKSFAQDYLQKKYNSDEWQHTLYVKNITFKFRAQPSETASNQSFYASSVTKYFTDEDHIKYFHEILSNHNYTFKQNIPAVNSLETSIRQGHSWAINHKLTSLIRNNRYYKPHDTKVKDFIEEQCVLHNINALLCKAIGLIYGIHGYQSDKVTAVAFIKNSKIHPFIMQTNLMLLQKNNVADNK